MEEERLGYVVEDGIILKSLKTGICAKITEEDGKYSAKLISRKEEEKIHANIKQYELPKHKKLILLIIFYTILGFIFFLARGIIGIIAIAVFAVTTCFQLYYLLPDIIYAIKHKKDAQYLYIFKKAYQCYLQGKEINKENILSTNFPESLKVAALQYCFWPIVITLCLLHLNATNGINVLIFEVVAFTIFLILIINKKLKPFWLKIFEKIFYRKPSASQIEIVLFGINFIKKYEDDPERIKYFYLN